MSKQYKVALVLKTNGLEFDDRIRKEILSIQHCNPNIHFKIFAMLPNNEEHEGISDYGVPYKSVYIKARDKYTSNSNILLKAYQFWRAVKNELKEYDAVWTADAETILITLLVRTKCLIWDLHELPTEFLTPWYRRLILKYAFHRTKVVVHANSFRLNYLKELGVVKHPERHYVLANYPEPSDNIYEQTTRYLDFVTWKGKRKCVYLQGLNDSSRAAYETIAAILSIDELYAVVVGNFDEKSKEKLVLDFSETVLNERVFFVGRIPQVQIASYMRSCDISAVFYKNTRENNYFCDANRFYLAASQGLPVVVGNNPSMRDIIEKYQFGISINNDGDDVEMIKKGLVDLLDRYDYFKKMTEENKEKLLWSSQRLEIKKIVKVIYNCIK